MGRAKERGLDPLRVLGWKAASSVLRRSLWQRVSIKCLAQAELGPQKGLG